MTDGSGASAYPPTVQPGIPRLGEVPHGWIRSPIGKHLIEERRPIKMDDDQTYDLVTVKRARGGVVKRETLEGRNISVKTQFEIHEGDFLISKRQIVHGACGVVPRDLHGSTVSNEYSVLRVRPTIDLQFLKYLSHSVHFQQTCFHSSIGVHIEKMIFKLDQWFKWKFDLPPIDEQRRIAEILGTWDRAIETTENLIAASEAQKKALLLQLIGQSEASVLTGVNTQTMPFSRFAKKSTRTINPRTYPSAKCIELESLQQDTGQILSVFDSITTDSTKIRFGSKSVLFGKLRPYLRKFAFPEFDGVCSSEIWVLEAEEDICLPKYLFYLVQTPTFNRAANVSSGSKMPRADWDYVQEAHFKIPHLGYQRRVIEVLSVADRTSYDLALKLQTLKTEKAALMQQLLTGKRRVNTKEMAA